MILDYQNMADNAFDHDLEREPSYEREEHVQHVSNYIKSYRTILSMITDDLDLAYEAIGFPDDYVCWAARICQASKSIIELNKEYESYLPEIILNELEEFAGEFGLHENDDYDWSDASIIPDEEWYIEFAI